MTRIARVLLSVLMAGTTLVSAQTTKSGVPSKNPTLWPASAMPAAGSMGRSSTREPALATAQTTNSSGPASRWAKPSRQFCMQAFSAASLSSAATSCRFGRPIRLRRTSRHSSTPEQAARRRMQLRRSRRRGHLSRRQHHPSHLPLELPHQFSSLSALVPGCRRPYLHHPQVSTRPAGAPRHPGRHIGLELYAPGRPGRSLLHSPQTLYRSGRKRGPHLLGLPRRQEPRRQRQYSDPGGIHLLEVALRRRHRIRRTGWSSHERPGSRVRSQLL